MKKIKGDYITLRITTVCDIRQDELVMYNMTTGEEKTHDEIEENDMENWILCSVGQVFADCDSLDMEDISYEEFVSPVE